MPAPTFIQKLVIPDPPPGAIDRPRLARQLDASAHVPLTVVHGPAGSGKTTAVAGWARQVSPTPAWVTLDRADRDPARLVTTLRAAFDRRLGRLSTLGVHPTTVEDAETLLVQLLAAVASAGERVTLVLDGVSDIRDSTASGLLLSLVSYLPGNLRVIVVARGRVPLAIGRLRLTGTLVEIDRQDLRLRPEETRALVRAAAGTVAGEVVDEVHRLAEGHATFTVAAARTVASHDLDDRRWAADVAGPHVDALGPDQRQLVTDVAPLTAVSGAMCDAITGRRGSAAILADLARETAVVVQTDDAAPTFRLHRLVQRALLDRLAVDDPGQVTATHRAAAHWKEQHGDVRGAIDEWISAGEDATAWALITEHHVATYFAGGRDVILGWLDHLSITSTPLDPQQAADRGALMLMVGRPDEASRWAAQADEWAAASGRRDELLPLTTYLRAQSLFLWGDLEGALALHRTVDREQVERPFIHLSAAASEVEILAQLGRFDEARRASLEMAPWAPFEGGLAQVIAPSVHASLALREGRLNEARALADEALAHARDLVGPDGPGTEGIHLTLGTVLLEQGQVLTAVPVLETARAAARRSGLVHLEVRAACALARASWLRGRPAEAFDTIEGARRSPHLHPLPDLLLGWLDHAEARLHLLAGDTSEALTILDRHHGHGGPATVVLRAWAALATGDRALAQDLLSEELGPAASVGDQIEADLVRVRTLRDPVRIRRQIGRAVHRGSVDGYLTVYLDHREGVVGALHDLRASEPSPYLTDLLLLLVVDGNTRVVESLTERELAVVTALQSTRSIETIAADLEVSTNTLKTHVKAIYRKLDATSRTDAVRRALILHLIGPEADGGERPITR